jgi:hypothetical protein
MLSAMLSDKMLLVLVLFWVVALACKGRSRRMD